ncbi:DHH family phosphoesterase [Priestia endophytica]|uniref:DHH family phosphoesterase n=1 Tax=Priestia endophytica TaxID=135735 RepID=UPI002280AC47|nr:DHH family phosphoesterase [Priestia endophytica]MCY8231213.1 DHH family phosphoesterase [Priestia endophytica]
MPIFQKKHIIRLPFYLLYSFALIITAIITYENWYVGAAGFAVLLGMLYLYIKMERMIMTELEAYISTLSHRVKKVGTEALMEMPIGIMLFNDDYQIEWTNSFLASCFAEETLVGRSLYDVLDSIVPLIKQEVESEVVTIYDRRYKVIIKRDERLVYFFDVTEQATIEKLYEEEKTVFGIIFLDNYDDLTQSMDDQVKSNLNNQVTSIINRWANEQGILIKRTSSERFAAILNERILSQLERDKFSILDHVREETSKQNISLTLSIGLGIGSSSLPELGTLAQSSLDLALGRGGDQVAIKLPSGKVKFYGGKTNPMEKRTRVRARVISHALKELITESENVIIMGHKYPDMDAIGAAIGILKVAAVNNKKGYIVLDQERTDSSVQKLLSEIKKDENLWPHFVSPEEALNMAQDQSLLVVVDTHKPSLVIEERLLNKIDSVVVIDHHRRGEDFVKNPLLVYMEPYASSTAELVTELLEYQPKRFSINMLEATALLAGIIVDTKSFTLRTGSRTFDAASFLRSQGADTVLVQKFLKEDMDHYVRRAKIIEKTCIYKAGIAISKAPENVAFSPVLIAQAADTLLSIDGVVASFVIAKREDDQVGISARSLGNVNVQVVMEGLQGGGHLTNAATQLQNINIDEAENRLKEVIDEYLEGGTQS